MWRYDHDLLLARTDYKPLDLGKITSFFTVLREIKMFLLFNLLHIFSYFPPDHFYNIIFIPPELSITGKSFFKKRTRFFQKTSTWILSIVALGWFLRSVTSLQVSSFHEEKNKRRPKSIKEKYRLRRICTFRGVADFCRAPLYCVIGSSDFDIFLEIPYASCVFGLALKS